MFEIGESQTERRGERVREGGSRRTDDVGVGWRNLLAIVREREDERYRAVGWIVERFARDAAQSTRKQGGSRVRTQDQERERERERGASVVRREHVYQCVIVPDGEGGVGDVVGEAHDGGGVGGIEQHWVIRMVSSERHCISRNKGTESEAEESCDKESGGLHDGGERERERERERVGERCAGGEGRRERGRERSSGLARVTEPEAARKMKT